ncbi:unnamed protein product [Effrenium voratum]|nr:unnamed protein product [Effrenium voratum]
MGRQLRVSGHPLLGGSYLEHGSCEGHPAYVKRSDEQETWILYSARFGSSPAWYFTSGLPEAGAMRSFCRSATVAPEPQLAQWDSNLQLCLEESPEVPSKLSEPQAIASLLQNAPAMEGLKLLHDRVNGALLEKVTASFAAGDASARELLEKVRHAHAEGSTELILLQEPGDSVEVGPGTMSLLCDVVRLHEPDNAGPPVYSWHKDGQALPRASKPRLVLSGAVHDVEGIYTCDVASGSDSVSTRPCRLRLSATALAQREQQAAQRRRFESPMRRAAGAVQLGELDRAIQLLSEAIKAAAENEAVRAEAFCQRAELHVQKGQWQDAFLDAVESLRLIPSLARAHAARGAAAEELGFLAEAASSWEAAELLGAVPGAAARAEACREKLHKFFLEQQAKRGTGAGQGADPEDGWRRNGWQGRYAGGSAGSFFGQGSSASPGLSKALEQHLKVLGLPAELPSAEVVRSAYRKLALTVHPDKPGGSKTKFQELQNAYEAVLKAVSSC